MKITIHRRPCLLQEATELVHAFVNQIPVEQMTGQGPYCIPMEEAVRIRREACQGLDPDSEALQFFFRGIPFEDKSSGLLSVARCMVYSLTEELIPDAEATVQMLLKIWPNYRRNAHINNISVYGIGFSDGESGGFHSLAKEITKLPVPAAFQMQLVEAFSDYEHSLRELAALLQPVIDKLAILLEPWVLKAQPLADQWEEYFSSEEHVRDFFMQKIAIPDLGAAELTFALHYLKSDLGLAHYSTEPASRVNLLLGVGLEVAPVDSRASKQSMQNCDYLILRQLANADRMSMLLAMMAAPMTAQEITRKLSLHPGSVFRDLNNMSNSNLLIRESLGSKETYRTNHVLIERLLQKILNLFDSAKP